MWRCATSHSTLARTALTLAPRIGCAEFLRHNPQPWLENLRYYCGGSPIVLGQWLGDGRASQREDSGGDAGGKAEARTRDYGLSDGEEVASRKQTAAIWLTLSGAPAAEAKGSAQGDAAPGSVARPVLRSLYCCGCPYRAAPHVIFYRPPLWDKLHYFSVQPFNPALDPRHDLGLLGGGGNPGDDRHASVTDMEVTLHQMNSARLFQTTVLEHMSSPAVLGALRRPRAISGYSARSSASGDRRSRRRARQRSLSSNSGLILPDLGSDGETSTSEISQDSDLSLSSLESDGLSSRPTASGEAPSGVRTPSPSRDPSAQAADDEWESGSGLRRRSSARPPSSAAGSATGSGDEADTTRTPPERHTRSEPATPGPGIGNVPASQAHGGSPGAAEVSSPRQRRPRSWLRRATTVPIVAFLFGVRVIFGSFLWLLQLRLPWFIPVFGNAPLRKTSFLGRQADHRLREVLMWPVHSVSLRKRGWQRPDQRAAEHVRLFNSMFLVVADVGVGIAAGMFLSKHAGSADVVLQWGHTIGKFLHVDVLQEQIGWLMGLPAGLKLNQDLTHFLGSWVLWMIELWNGLTTILTPLEPIFVVAIATLGIGGLTFMLAIAADALELMTVHIYLLYSAFAWLHNMQLSILGSLWRLFRGKKWNVLRHRVDSCDYDVPQLLVGTLLFTVLFFLFPTSLVYYVFFTIVHLMVLVARGGLWWALAICNHFPVFNLITYVANPGRLPGGIRLVPVFTAGEPVPVRTAATADKRGQVDHSSGGDTAAVSGSSVDGGDSVASGAAAEPLPEAPLLRRVQTEPTRASQRQGVTRRVPQLFADDRAEARGADYVQSAQSRASSRGQGSGQGTTADAGDYWARRREQERVQQASEGALQQVNEAPRNDVAAVADGFIDVERDGPSEASYFALHGMTVSFASLFSSYAALTVAMGGHYTPAVLLRTLVLGVYVPPSKADFGRFQQPRLPAQGVAGIDHADKGDAGGRLAVPKMREYWGILEEWLEPTEG